MEEIYEIIKNDFISNYNGEDGSIAISNGNNFTFQITTVKNELNILYENQKSNFSVIDLKECANILKIKYDIDNNTDLIILKYENENEVSNGNEKSIQYEVYDPNSNTKLNLSFCSNINIDIYINIQLKEETQKLYEDLKSQGYNLFDKNDKFYTDICTPYESKNGTDVLLSDRLNDFFNENQLQCQDNCEYSDYISNSQYLKCECNVVNEEEINTKEPEKITLKSIPKSFYNVLKYSNYKVLKCYKLVFRKATIKKNIGSILSNIYFIGYLIAFGIFCYKKISYLQNEIEKLFIDEEKKNNNDAVVIYNKSKNNSEIDNNKIDIKGKTIEDNNENQNNNKANESKKRRYKKKRKTDIENKNKAINGNYLRNVKRINSSKNNDINTIKESISDNKIMATKDIFMGQMVINDINNNLKDNNQENNIKVEDKKEKKILSDYELNDLEYLEALEIDDRNFFKIYWYYLNREHLILFTFFNWNDFNIFSIKLSKMFFCICTDMAFNVFFFSDESMHNIYTSGGKHDFFGQLAQMIYSTIVSQVLQIFINYLTMTDIHY